MPGTRQKPGAENLHRVLWIVIVWNQSAQPYCTVFVSPTATEQVLPL